MKLFMGCSRSLSQSGISRYENESEMHTKELEPPTTAVEKKNDGFCGTSSTQRKLRIPLGSD
ncbi:hypothetical protein L1049_027068 [Liquidambar formosana]|uniref:Uncharacterized protein n=1 Tax=Liquidambar formosana TaxID=63359 RepID=A0AAP0R2N7_LIQFO